MKIKKTVYAVAIFIAVIIWALANEAMASEAYDGFRASVGKTLINSSHTYGEFGYEYKRWEVTLGQIGQDDPTTTYSLSRLVRPSWQFLGATNYYRLGYVYVSDSPLVGDTNFRLGIGLEWTHVQLEYFHFSSAGIHDPNTGVDGIQLRIKL